VLSKDGYRPAKAIQLSSGCSSSAEGSLNSDMVSKTSGSKDNACKGGGISSSNNSKQPKKTSKFLRARLGDNSLATLDLSRPSASPERPERESQGPQLGLPVRGAWKNGGGQNLFSSNGRK
jgi:E3 ubiquitin-protein ligase ZNF598